MSKNNKTQGVPIAVVDIEKAKAGWVVCLSEKGDLILVDPATFTKEAVEFAEEAKGEADEFRAFAKHVRHFRKICKSHFANAFSLWKSMVITGEIEPPEDERLMNAARDVLDGTKTVIEALEENAFLKTIYEEIYGKIDENDIEEEASETACFPEV